ncbi:MAG: transcriptional repressor LexA [Spirochaetaceae bacterium]|nr:MAG: transcriptional repressor LexA [Spirochaetaceae bacterium]
MKGLTKRQRDVLDFIRQFIGSNKYPPTIREVAEKFKISVKGSYDHIKALEKKQYIKCTGNRSRAIEIVEHEPEANITRVPLLGSVAAGKPLFAAENFEGMVGVPTQLLRKGKHFALNMRGDSMQEAGIMDGDIAIINHRNIADNGDIVVAVLDDAVTLKRFFKEKNRVMLKSENKSYPPIYSQEIKILGRLACIIRKYE